jgi:D-arginine dehydrogenase
LPRAAPKARDVVNHRVDIAIIGAGMAGASLAAEAAPHASVLVIEAEDQPGYHATGRSAAFWAETYGGPLVRPLTAASRPLLAAPPPDFSERSFLRPRGSVTLGRHEDLPLLEEMLKSFGAAGVRLDWLDRAALAPLVPGLKPQWIAAVAEPGCSDIDVGGLHAAYLRQARQRGAEVLTGAPVSEIERRNGRWQLRAGGCRAEADILVDAAGAWADPIAVIAGVRAVGIQPYRRTMVQLRTDPPAPETLPLVLDSRGAFYFKPESGGRLWLTPHDETPLEACDVSPEETDVAVAIDRLEGVVHWRVTRVEHRWAGLRSFAPDRLPVYGFDPAVPGFFWFAGQGGFGIQTAPAAAKLAASLLLGRSPDPLVADVDPQPYSAGRFAN